MLRSGRPTVCSSCSSQGQFSVCLQGRVFWACSWVRLSGAGREESMGSPTPHPYSSHPTLHLPHPNPAHPQDSISLVYGQGCIPNQSGRPRQSLATALRWACHSPSTRFGHHASAKSALTPPHRAGYRVLERKLSPSEERDLLEFKPRSVTQAECRGKGVSGKQEPAGIWSGSMRSLRAWGLHQPWFKLSFCPLPAGWF